MLRKCAPLSLMKKTASIFFLPLVFVWLLLIMTNAPIVYAQFLPAPTTTFQQPYHPVNPFPVNSFQQTSTTFPSQSGGPGTGFLPPSGTTFQPSYTLPLARWLVLPPTLPSSVIPTGVAPPWFPSSILLSQIPNQQQFDFERLQQQLTQNAIQGQQLPQVLQEQQQQQQIVTNEQQQNGVSSNFVRSLINLDDHQKQTMNDENRQCINNTCTNQLTQCTNGVCTTTTTNDIGNTQMNTQVCNSGSNSASSSCSVRQTQTTQCAGGVCTVTQTECINGICITRTF